MKTIPRNWPRKPGDYPAMCDYCGVMWPRSRLWRDRAGNLVCPQEGLGADAVTLSLENASDARRRRGAFRHRDGGNIDRDDPARPGDILDVLGSSVVLAWWRGDDVVLDTNGNAQRVRSRAPGGLDGYQSDPDLRPTPVSWGSGALSFGTTDVVTARNAHDWVPFTGRHSATAGIVVKGLLAGDVAWEVGAPGVYTVLGATDGSLRHWGSSAPVVTAYTVDQADKQIIWITGDYQSDGTKDWTMEINGVTVATSTQTDVTEAAPAYGMRFASDGDAGILAEAFIAKRVLTDAEKASVEAYWARYP